MNTNYFYEKFLLNNYKLPELDQVYHHIYSKGRDKRYMVVNDMKANYVGYPLDQMKFLSDRDIVTDPISYQSVENNDQSIIQSNATKLFSEYYVVNKRKETFLSIKTPFYNANEVIGVCGISIIINEQSLANFYSIMEVINHLFQENIGKKATSHYQLEAQSKRPELTLRELDCLRFYMRGSTTKNIAEVLFLSPRTIEYYIENIKSKFGVNTRAELLNMAFNLYPELM